MTNKKICILGAAGSIGSRLVGLLHKQGFQVTAVVRSLSSAVRIGRLDIAIVSLDLLTASKAQLSDVIVGHDVVIDCTYSTNSDYQQRIDESKKLANTICDAAEEAHVSRLIHYGTISVYPSGVSSIDESVACEMSGDAYADGKLAAEMIFLERNSVDLLITVLQLPIVFGPYMGWSCAPVTQMSGRCLVMPNDLNGSCAPLFVDDVAQATVAAFDCKESYGERILLSNPSMSWPDYYSAYSALSSSLSFKCIERTAFRRLQKRELFDQQPFQRLKNTFINDGDFRQLILAQWGIRNLYALVKRMRGQTGVDQIKQKIESSVPQNDKAEQSLLSSHTVTLFDSLPAVNSRKAKEILKFEPSTDFTTAMSITHEWLKWARLIN